MKADTGDLRYPQFDSDIAERDAAAARTLTPQQQVFQQRNMRILGALPVVADAPKLEPLVREEPTDPVAESRRLADLHRLQRLNQQALNNSGLDQ